MLAIEGPVQLEQPEAKVREDDDGEATTVPGTPEVAVPGTPEVEVLEDGVTSTVLYNDGASVPEPELTHPNFPICNLAIDKKKSGWRNTLHSRVYKLVLNFWIREGVPEEEACDRASKYWLHTCKQLGI